MCGKKSNIAESSTLFKRLDEFFYYYKRGDGHDTHTNNDNKRETSDARIFEAII